MKYRESDCLPDNGDGNSLDISQSEVQLLSIGRGAFWFFGCGVHLEKPAALKIN